jgi:hypothetical protein
MKEIFPKSILENSVFAHRKKFKVRSLLIYNFITWFVLISFIALPFIKIDTFNTFYGKVIPEKIDEEKNGIEKMVVEGYLTHSEIIFFNKGTELDFSVHGLKTNEWESVKGTVTKVSNQAEILNDLPSFKVTCSIEDAFITNKNDYKLKLVKDMKLMAKYDSKEKSLFSLFFSKKTP